MFKHTISELKEALVCLEAGQVTLKYPFEPHAPDANFRGKVEIDTALCVGCGACANACPATLISVNDAEAGRTLHFELGRCTFCAACRDVCPQKAITLTPQFETATPNISDLQIRFVFKLVHCRECGRVVNTRRAVNLVREQLGQDYGGLDWLDLCPDCRRKMALQTPDLVLEVTV
jgi:hydrogenase-4 component H